MSVPAFAVVGHPNKGKSSIVATLAHDDSVRIAAEPGTTVECRRYPMRVDGVELYALVDTPGFQRARHALAWMRQHETTAARHPDIVREFVETHRGTDKFFDECELLAPLLDGAGILYVVDGSRPYGSEYEAEMEILRWTGRPSMALINPIREEDHVAEWKNALGQYFKVVRVFDAHTAEFDKRLELLRAFGQLEDAWRAPLERAVDVLAAERRLQLERASRSIAQTLAESLQLSVTKDLPVDATLEAHKPGLVDRYKEEIRRRERRGRAAVQELYGHREIRCTECDATILDEDLFSLESWYAFGLSRGQLAAAGAVSGATIGGTVDAAVGGASFLVGTAIGSLIGGAAGWLSAAKMGRHTVLKQPLGGRRLRYGPSRNRSFPHVLLGRARHHHLVLSGRTHARREEVNLQDDRTADLLPPLPADRMRELERLFERLRGAEAAGDLVPELARSVQSILERDADPKTQNAARRR